MSGPGADGAHLRLASNTIRGSLWWGEWRPGSIVLGSARGVSEGSAVSCVRDCAIVQAGASVLQLGRECVHANVRAVD